MRVIFNKEFHRLYKKANVRIRKNVDENIRIFRINSQDPQLNNHPLKEEWQGYRSIDITAKYRAIYKEVIIGETAVVYFVVLGTHDELYKPIAE